MIKLLGKQTDERRIRLKRTYSHSQSNQLFWRINLIFVHRRKLFRDCDTFHEPNDANTNDAAMEEAESCSSAASYVTPNTSLQAELDVYDEMMNDLI